MQIEGAAFGAAVTQEALAAPRQHTGGTLCCSPWTTRRGCEWYSRTQESKARALLPSPSAVTASAV
jgi:hypothetical protein